MKDLVICFLLVILALCLVAWVSTPVVLLLKARQLRKADALRRAEAREFEEFDNGHPELWDVDAHEDEFEALDEEVRNRKEHS